MKKAAARLLLFTDAYYSRFLDPRAAVHFPQRADCRWRPCSFLHVLAPSLLSLNNFRACVALLLAGCAIPFLALCYPRVYIKVRGGFEPGFNLGSNFSFLLLEFKPGFNLGSNFWKSSSCSRVRRTLLNLGSTWVLIGFHSTWVQPGLNLG